MTMSEIEKAQTADLIWFLLFLFTWRENID